MKSSILLFALILTSFSAYSSSRSSGYVSLDNPIQIIDGSEPRAFLYEVSIRNSGCSRTTPVLLLDSSRFLAKEFYSTILMAKASGKRVNIISDGCWLNGQYPIVASIFLE